MAVTAAQLKLNRRTLFIGLLLASITLFAFNTVSTVPKVHHRYHTNHHHKKSDPRSHITTFDLCVANRENGEPGSTSYNDINWFAINEYYGAYSFLHPTWISAGGGRFANNANEATPDEQSIIFNEYSARDPGAWPETIPPCLYLR